MKIRVLLIIAFTLQLVTSCNRSTEIDLSKISNCQDNYRGKRVTVEGYFGVNRDKGGVVCETEGKYKFCLLAFTSEPKARTRFDVIVPLGVGTNRMKSPLPSSSRIQAVEESNLDELTRSLHIFTDDGKTINGMRRVRITGVAGNCDITVEKIEAL